MEDLSPRIEETGNPGLNKHEDVGPGGVLHKHQQQQAHNNDPAVTSNFIGRHNNSGDCKGVDAEAQEEVLLPLNPKSGGKASKMKQPKDSSSKSSKQRLNSEQDKLKLGEDACIKTAPVPPPASEEEMEAFRQKVLAAQKHRQTAVGEFIVHDTLAPPDDKFFRLVDEAQNKVYAFWGRIQKTAWRVVMVAMVVAYLVYLGFAIHYSVKGAAALICLTIMGGFYVLRTRLLKRQCVRCQLWVAEMAARCSNGSVKQIAKW